jgi:type II secretory pathway component GspD/PulD (secretin)
MNTFTIATPRLLIGLLTGFGLSIWTTAPLSAQTANKTATATPVAVAGQKVDLNFQDAYLSEVAEFLTERFPGTNFVVPPKAAQIRISMKLRNVTLAQTLEAIAFASENRVKSQELTEDMFGFQPTLELENESPGKVTCRMFSLAAPIEALSDHSEKGQNDFFAELNSTIEGATKLLHEADPLADVESPRLQFHPATKLLVVVGKPAALNMVEQFVFAMGGRSAEVPGKSWRGVGETLLEKTARKALEPAPSPTSPAHPAPKR